jgi:hypothetical protein
LLPAPVCTACEATAPKLSRKNITAATQKTGFFSW